MNWIWACWHWWKLFILPPLCLHRLREMIPWRMSGGKMNSLHGSNQLDISILIIDLCEIVEAGPTSYYFCNNIGVNPLLNIRPRRGHMCITAGYVCVSSSRSLLWALHAVLGRRTLYTWSSLINLKRNQARDIVGASSAMAFEPINSFAVTLQ